MMEKVIPVGSWDFGVEPTAQIKVASTGLRGYDRLQLEKRSSSDHVFSHLVDKIDLKPGDMPIHAIAIGATEDWGCFFADTLVQTYDGMRSIQSIQTGDLLLTHNNQYRPVSHCFNRSYTGDKVSIHVQGLPQPEIATGNHPFWIIPAEDFTTQHRAPSLNKSADWTLEKSVQQAMTKARFVEARDVRVGDYVVVPTSPVDVTAEPMDDSLAYFYGVYLAEGCVRHKYRKVKSTTSKRRGLSGVVFALHKTKDKELSSAIATVADSMDRSLQIQDSKTSDKSVRTTLTDVSVARACVKLFGRHSRTKRIPPAIFSQSRDWRLEFLAGYFDGDGCLSKDKNESRYENVLRANTASLNLALDVQRLLASLSLPSSVSRGTNRKSNGCFGKTDNAIYEISVASAYSQELRDRCRRLSGIREVSRRKQARSWFCPGYMLLKVKETASELVVDEPVFNFEVEDAHTYVTQVVGHNCNRNGDGFNRATCQKQAHTFVGRPLNQYQEGEHNGARLYLNHRNKHPPTSYGYVKAAAYNPRMHRIELLLLGNASKQAAERNGGLVMPDDLLEKLAKDKLVPWSMACKIAYDVCSICGNHAPSREHYCTKESCIGPDGFHGLGCRYGLTKLAASGRQQFVENPNAVFFDFSKVTRPADRTAYGGRAAYLEKAASDAFIEGGAALAELFSRENYPSDGLLLSNGSESVVARAMKLAAVLADLEQTLAVNPSIEDKVTANAFHPLMQPPMDLRGMSGAGAMKMAEGFRAIHEAGAMISLADFVKIAAPDAAGDVVADSVASASRHLPGIYRRLLESDDLRSRLQKDAAAVAAAGQPSAAQRALAQKLAASRSCRMNDVRERVSRAGLALSGTAGPRLQTGAHEKIASDGNGEELARRYAVQKLIFLASRPEDSELMLTAKLANLQNHVI